MFTFYGTLGVSLLQASTWARYVWSCPEMTRILVTGPQDPSCDRASRSLCYVYFSGGYFSYPLPWTSLVTSPFST